MSKKLFTRTYAFVRCILDNAKWVFQLSLWCQSETFMEMSDWNETLSENHRQLSQVFLQMFYFKSLIFSLSIYNIDMFNCGKVKWNSKFYY